MLLQGNIKLIPQKYNIPDLKKDYVSMQENGMFFGKTLSFEELQKGLELLEGFLFSHISSSQN